MTKILLALIIVISVYFMRYVMTLEKEVYILQQQAHEDTKIITKLCDTIELSEVIKDD